MTMGDSSVSVQIARPRFTQRSSIMSGPTTITIITAMAIIIAMDIITVPRTVIGTAEFRALTVMRMQTRSMV